ncbi:DNA polymerase III subunit delta [bacterium]|nr:DNA polymerase III subunit delta [bacterium]
MLFFYYGEDSFRAKQKIDAIVKKFQNKIDTIGQNVQYLDGEEMKDEDFFRAVSVMGFLADKKLIIVKNIFNNKKLKNWQDELIAFIKKQADTPDENYIIFWQASKADSRTKLYKILSKVKFVEEFRPLSGNELSAWIKKQVTSHDKTISPSALNLLISYVGNNLWQMNQEISKLAHFVKKEITDDDVKQLVQAKIDDNIFNLIDALGNKNKSLALKLIEEKIDHGINHQYILTMIVRQFRILIKTKAIEDQIKYPGALSQTLKIHPLVAAKTLSQSKMYNMEQLKDIYKKLLILDEKFKTTQNQEKILFATMINEM